MTPDPAPTPNAAPRVDHLLLPTLRQRLYESFGFLALSQTAYLASAIFSLGENHESRLVLNIVRLAILYACLFGLRKEASRGRTLALAAIGLSAQLVIGAGISVLRHDVVPTAILTVALTSISSVMLPWGVLPQALLAGGGMLTLLAATLEIHRQTGNLPSFDLAGTLTATNSITIYIAHSLDRSRRDLARRLDEARQADEELAALRAQLERRVAERTAELEMANRELEGFSYTVSHDLRSPLRTISGFSQMILDETGDGLSASARDNLAKIRAASRRMDTLIDDMLVLARVGRSALRHEAVDPAAMAWSIAQQLRTEFPDRHVMLTVGEIPLVHGDHALLRIALDNLLRNAWKFTAARPDAAVTVSGERLGNSVVVRVRDNGVGFDPRFRAKLFRPFERLHPEDERFPGTGVGLATVARIVRRHGGDVDAEGSVDGGATFSMTLPATRPA